MLGNCKEILFYLLLKFYFMLKKTNGLPFLPAQSYQKIKKKLILCDKIIACPSIN